MSFSLRAIGPALLLTLAGCAKPMPPSLGHSLHNARAPEFHEFSTSSWDVGLPAGPATRVTVVDFWASWCEECVRTMPEMERLYRDKKSDGVMVIGVSVDENADDATASALSHRASFPIVLDPRMRIAGLYRVGQIPLTFVVDRKGEVRWVGRDSADLRRAVDALLSE